MDFENRIINVDHQLLKNKEVGYYIETPKTKSGIRQVPMSDEACMIFQRVLKNRRKLEPIIIDGYSDFVFLNQQGYPITIQLRLEISSRSITSTMRAIYQMLHRISYAIRSVHV